MTKVSIFSKVVLEMGIYKSHFLRKLKIFITANLAIIINSSKYTNVNVKHKLKN
jgi:hypothetical protein